LPRGRAASSRGTVLTPEASSHWAAAAAEPYAIPCCMLHPWPTELRLRHSCDPSPRSQSLPLHPPALQRGAPATLQTNPLLLPRPPAAAQLPPRPSGRTPCFPPDAHASCAELQGGGWPAGAGAPPFSRREGSACGGQGTSGWRAGRLPALSMASTCGSAVGSKCSACCWEHGVVHAVLGIEIWAREQTGRQTGRHTVRQTGRLYA